MKFAQLKKSLISNVESCYMIFGEDSFLCEASVNLIEKQLFGNIDKNNLNKQVFSSEDLNVKKLIDCLNVVPFFADKKLVIYKDYDGKKNAELSEKIKEYLKLPCESTVFVIITSTDSDIFKNLQKYCTDVDCSRLEKPMLIKWIENSLQAKNAQISPDACELLISFTNGYLSRISLELEKLVSLSGGDIKSEHIKAIVPKDLEYSIFELTDSLSKGDTFKAQTIKQDLLSDKKNYAVIQNLICNHFRRLFFALTSEGTDAEIASMLSVKEYAITKAKQLATKFGAKKLKEIVELCADLDYKTKTSQMSQENAVNYLFMKILSI